MNIYTEPIILSQTVLNGNASRSVMGKKREVIIYDSTGKELTLMETVTEIQQFWSPVYQKQENNIMKVWTGDTRHDYIEKCGSSVHTVKDLPEYRIPYKLREHMDMAVTIEKEVMPMKTQLISENEIKLVLQKLKNKNAPGPDGCKPEFYKTLICKNESIKAITRCLNNVLEPTPTAQTTQGNEFP